MGIGSARETGEGYWPDIPGSLNGIKDYFGQKGFREGPSLEADEGQIASFEKPLPEGRVHIKVFAGPKYYRIVQHRDAQDPNRNLVGHLQDVLFSPDKITQKVKRTD
jgi:hypothetical protein